MVFVIDNYRWEKLSIFPIPNSSSSTLPPLQNAALLGQLLFFTFKDNSFSSLPSFFRLTISIGISIPGRGSKSSGVYMPLFLRVCIIYLCSSRLCRHRSSLFSTIPIFFPKKKISRVFPFFLLFLFVCDGLGGKKGRGEYISFATYLRCSRILLVIGFKSIFIVESVLLVRLQDPTKTSPSTPSSTKYFPSLSPSPSQTHSHTHTASLIFHPVFPLYSKWFFAKEIHQTRSFRSYIRVTWFLVFAACRQKNVIIRSEVL